MPSRHKNMVSAFASSMLVLTSKISMATVIVSDAAGPTNNRDGTYTYHYLLKIVGTPGTNGIKPGKGITPGDSFVIFNFPGFVARSAQITLLTGTGSGNNCGFGQPINSAVDSGYNNDGLGNSAESAGSITPGRITKVEGTIAQEAQAQAFMNPPMASASFTAYGTNNLTFQNTSTTPEGTYSLNITTQIANGGTEVASVYASVDTEPTNSPPNGPCLGTATGVISVPTSTPQLREEVEILKQQLTSVDKQITYLNEEVARFLLIVDQQPQRTPTK
jgi:hypothetical protein